MKLKASRSSSRNRLPVVIAGGGIGGLAAALALARKGFRSIVLEQAPQFGAIGAGIAFVALKALASVVRLREITFVDPLSFVAAVAIVAGAAALAAYQPSRRATRVNPAETLRSEA